MAPPRRKGRAAAAAAAAARQKWKVGDLVLAKMKGFPPWPAAISEPQKWGYSSDRKKLFVYFFGTKQIAFCNHADVEAFTEEKKKTLLVKRQGKGADFVRAIDEIVDSFEKLKEQKIDGEFSSGDEAIESNIGNMECSSVSSCLKSPKDPLSTSNCQPGAICSLQGNSEEVPMTSIEDDTMENKGSVHEQPNGNVSILDQLKLTPLANIGSHRKRSRDTSSQKSDVQKRAPSLRRSRSSTKLDLSNLQKPEVRVEADSCGNDLVSDVLLEECSLNSKVVGRSPVVQEADSGVSTLVPNNSCEDIGSGTAAVELGARSLSEGCKIEFNCKAESRAENLDKGLVLSEGLDIQRNMVVLKKKRKPNKKRLDQEMAAHTKLEKGIHVLVEPSKNIPILSEACQSIDEKHSKADGDEHLPLVKRARVRMGNLPEEKKLDDLIGTAEKYEKVDLGNHDVNVSDETFLNAGKGFNNSSPSNDHMRAREYDTIPWKRNMYPLRGSTMDVEAALPPSKRLHRALEAMSANAAEASNDCLEELNSRHTSSTENKISKTGSCHILLDRNCRSPRELHGAIPTDTNEMSTSMLVLPASFTSQIPETSTECCPDVTYGDISHGNSASLRSMDCKGKLVDAKGSKDLCNKTEPMELHDGHPCFSEVREEKVIATSGHNALNPSSSPVMKENTKEILQLDHESPLDVMKGEDSNSQVVKLGSENQSGKQVPENVDCISKAEVGGNLLPLNATVTTDSIMDGASLASHPSRDVRSSSSLSGEKCGPNVQEATVGMKHKLTPKRTGFSPDSTPMKVLIAAAQAKRFSSRSGSLSENVNCKLIPDGASRSSLIHKANKISPPNSVINHTPALNEETSSLQSSSRSPDATMQLKNSIHVIDADEVHFDSASTHKQKSLNKSMGHAEATTARKSFEMLLSSLSRTKESIGRATRLAIDCAKYGIAGEVVQILLQTLEKELSLSRRLDLFFLVDSITQCSRGQKGVTGDAYPSLVQLVLPRLLSVAAPPGNAAWDNRRQCLKVLRLWLERRILPESIVRHHIRELESVNEASFSSGSSRRPPRTERPLNDPVREMEGMLVDEYGSNASFQIAGLLGSRMLDDEEESIDDEKSFETVTPEHEAEACKETEGTVNCIPEKHTHILEDVDGELEMEDASPPSEPEMSSPHDTAGVSTEHASQCRFDKHSSLPFPPLPAENPPSPPPLPSSPPPVAPPCPSISSFVPPPPASISQNHADALDSHSYMGTSNMQYPLSGHQPSAPSVNSSDRVDCYAPGYVDRPKQMHLPVSSLKSSSSFGFVRGSHPSVHSANDSLSLSSGPLHNKGYHLQPPPPAITKQFSHAQPEKERMQTWGDCSFPFDRRGMFATEAQGAHFYGDRHARGPVQHEISERCRFSAAVRSGPMLPEKVEASANLRAYYGPPAETSSIPSHSWTIPPRASTYQYSLAASRPLLENQVSRVSGARDYWRPR